MKWIFILPYFILQFAYAQTAFKLYHAIDAVSCNFKIGNQVKYNLKEKHEYYTDEIVTINDSGFTKKQNGFIAFKSINSIGRQYPKWEFVTYTLISLTELNLIGAMIRASDSPKIAAAFIFIVGNSVLIPTAMHYHKPNTSKIRRVDENSTFIVFSN